MSKEEMRQGFEAWHCEQYKTKYATGAPTRDLHGGVYDEKYGPKKQQALWECWQETDGDVAKVEALKEEIERVEAGKQPVAGQSRFTSQKDWQPCSYEHHLMVIANPGEWPGYETRALYTRSDAGEVDHLNTVVEQQKNLIASLRSDLMDPRRIDKGPAEGDHDGRQLEWERAENKRLKTIADNYCALGMDANQEIFRLRAQLADAAQSLETISLQAGRDEFMKDMTQIRGYANSRAMVAKGSLSANAEPNKIGAGEVKL